jgi:cytochrome c peroxidase
MKKIALALSFAIAAYIPAVAGIVVTGVWESSCSGCHNGGLAQSADQLKTKFKTPQEFVKAAQSSTNPMMMGFKNDVETLKKAAKELYGK